MNAKKNHKYFEVPLPRSAFVICAGEVWRREAPNRMGPFPIHRACNEKWKPPCQRGALPVLGIPVYSVV